MESINGDVFCALYSEDEIIKRIQELGTKINEIYKKGNEVDIIVVLKGGFMFASDLIKTFKFKNHIHFIEASLYRGKKTHNDDIRIKGLEHVPSDKHYFIIDDIYDTGKTINTITKKLEEKHPISISSCVLLSKQKSMNDVDFVGFFIPDVFVFGYGMDKEEKYRGLPFVLVDR